MFLIKGLNYKCLSPCWLPAGSGWSSKAPACWAQAKTGPQRWPPLGHHSCWHTACRSPLGWAVLPAPDTTASSERLNETKLTLLIRVQTPHIVQHVHISKPRALHEMHPSSPGTLGSERFSGILHWSTWSFNALTSSMSPGTLKIKHNSSVTLADHKRDLYLHHDSKSTTHAHSLNMAWWLKERHYLFAVLLWNETKKHSKHNTTQQCTEYVAHLIREYFPKQVKMFQN